MARKELPSGVKLMKDRPERVRTSQEKSAAMKFAAALNVLTFDSYMFAFFVSQENIAIKKRALEALLKLVYLDAFSLDASHF